MMRLRFAILVEELSVWKLQLRFVLCANCPTFVDTQSRDLVLVWLFGSMIWTGGGRAFVLLPGLHFFGGMATENARLE